MDIIRPVLKTNRLFLIGGSALSLYTYDAAGNVTSVLSSNANGTSVNYSYDQNNRLQSVTDNRTTGTTNYTYDATNRIQSFTYPNGVTHSYTYDNRDRNTILSANGTTYTQSYSFSGRQQSVAESGGRNTSYSYDSIYRLLGENINGAPSNGLLNYSLDAVGNRLSLTSTLAALQSQTASYDANDHISGDTVDANGNTLTSNGVTYAYDFEDRLLSTSTGVQIVYDGDGNRVSETAGGVTTKFLVDGQNPTGYAQVAEEIVGTVTAQYTHGLMRISQSRSGAVSYYGYDSGASVRQLFDNTGAVTDTYAYDAFGNTIARTGTTVNPYQYRGEQYDASLQMYSLRARYYRPQVGRFLTQDSYEGDDEDPLSLHRYVYTHDDPVDGTDPTGYANLFSRAFQSLPVIIQRGLWYGWNLGTRTLGIVRNGGKIAYETVCCLDKAWSVLGLAIGFIATVDPSPENLRAANITLGALALIAAACRLNCGRGSGGGPFFGPGGGGIPPSSMDGILGDPLSLVGVGVDLVVAIAKATSGWEVVPSGQGAHKGLGTVIRERNPDGNLTGRQVRWHPGSTRPGHPEVAILARLSTEPSGPRSDFWGIRWK